MYLRFRVLCIMVRIPRNEELVRYIAYRLRELRLARGLSQEKVLFETGVRVEHIEMGRNNITISTPYMNFSRLPLSRKQPTHLNRPTIRK